MVRGGDRARGTTIYDVADRADVSVATVSRVMRGTARVAEPTRRRVEHAMADLRFTPSRLGVSLAVGRHAANGIVFPDLTGPYFAEVVLGYEDAAAELQRSVLILSTHGRGAARDRVLDLAGRVDGLVVMGRTVSDEVVAEVAASGVPVVTLARPPVSGTDSVEAENAATAAVLAQHLIDHGCRSIVLLGEPDSSPDVAARWRGATERLATPGVVVEQVPSGGFDVSAGYTAGLALLAGARPDAVLCANDEVALGLMDAAATAGVSVPDELAVTGWDDVMAARFAGLTTVRQPMRQLGATAARLLDDRLQRTASSPRHEVLPTQLVVRASCGPHPEEDAR